MIQIKSKMHKLYYKIKRAIACAFIKKKIPLNLSKPIISFCFDDIPDSAITNGARILAQYGYKGTYYISLGLRANEDKSKPYFDHSKLKQLVANGGELACHTADHIRLYESSKRVVLNDLKKNQEKLNELIPGYTFKNFSYPSGQQTFISKLILRKRYKTARGVKAGMHIKEVDINNLYANALVKRLTLENALARIDKAIENNAWIIFYTHDVENNPSDYGCTPEYFENVVKYCSQKNMDVCTINDAINKIVLERK
jgi:peptidoglycan/xylan/chitin deacetylase (PgdA/CDA1 family)